MTAPDHNYRSYADQFGFLVEDLTVDPRHDGLDAGDFADLLKLSNVQHATFRRLVVHGEGAQQENAIDMNRGCVGVLIDTALLQAGNQNAITIKGGCEEIELRDVTIMPGGHCDIELGNWSDQSSARTTGVRLIRVRRWDGKPVRLRVGHADEPIVEDCEIERQFWASLALKAYVKIKFLFVRWRAKSP